MANDQINEYLKERTAATAKPDDYMDWDSTEDSGTTFESAKMKLSELVTYISGLITTLYTGNGSLTSDREVNLGSNILSFLGIGRIGIGINAVTERKLYINTSDDETATYSLNNSGKSGSTGVYAATSGNSASSFGAINIALGGDGTQHGSDNKSISPSGITNIGGKFSATGGLNNYAIIVPENSGNIGFGTETPSAKVDIVSDGSTAGTSMFRGVNSNSETIIDIKDDGQTFIDGVFNQIKTAGTSSFLNQLAIGGNNTSGAQFRVSGNGVGIFDNSIRTSSTTGINYMLGNFSVGSNTSSGARFKVTGLSILDGPVRFDNDLQCVGWTESGGDAPALSADKNFSFHRNTTSGDVFIVLRAPGNQTKKVQLI